MKSAGIVTSDRSKALSVLGHTQTAQDYQAYLKRLPDGRWLAQTIHIEEEQS